MQLHDDEIHELLEITADLSERRRYAPVMLVAALNDMAAMTRRGIAGFDAYAADPAAHEGWLVYDPSDGRVVLDRLVDELHADIIGHYDDLFDGVTMRVDECDGDMFVTVDLPCGGIVVEDGRWYASEYR